ncbi:formin-like protein 14 [Echinops telfairi]|uniref:Formin-like protein 14 n=1 Tax=Echinops telfairi TaxID=9371 RepID=A0ABM0ZR31_ECHTE|nr:formin-like protein 14 [Echinops telfairi]
MALATAPAGQVGGKRAHHQPTRTLQQEPPSPRPDSPTRTFRTQAPTGLPPPFEPTTTRFIAPEPPVLPRSPAPKTPDPDLPAGALAPTFPDLSAARPLRPPGVRAAGCPIHSGLQRGAERVDLFPGRFLSAGSGLSEARSPPPTLGPCLGRYSGLPDPLSGVGAPSHNHRLPHNKGDPGGRPEPPRCRDASACTCEASGTPSGRRKPRPRPAARLPAPSPTPRAKSGRAAAAAEPPAAHLCRPRAGPAGHQLGARRQGISGGPAAPMLLAPLWLLLLAPLPPLLPPPPPGLPPHVSSETGAARSQQPRRRPAHRR